MDSISLRFTELAGQNCGASECTRDNAYRAEMPAMASESPPVRLWRILNDGPIPIAPLRPRGVLVVEWRAVRPLRNAPDIPRI